MKTLARWTLMLCLVACATTPRPPPGDELEEGGLRQGAFESAPSNERALEDSFHPSPAESLEPSRGVPAPTPAPATPLSRAPRAFDRELRAALNSQDVEQARELADEWLLSCGPEKVDSCRAGALAAMSSLGRLKSPGARAAADKATTWRKHDDCLRSAEAAARAQRPVPECLGAAVGAYKHAGDGLMVARAHLARGLAAGKDHEAEQVAQLQRVEKDCREPRCVQVRRRALRALANVHLRKDALEPALRLLFREQKVAAELLPPDRRLYARLPDVDKLCARLDAKGEPARCRKLEREETGGYTFTDFSSRRAGPGGLSSEQVKRVNEHFSVLLQACLAEEADRLEPPAVSTFAMRWTVRNDGRVERVEFAKKDQADSPAGRCARQQFELWRYPTYEGELQHVQQSFTVSAHGRRS